MIGRLNGTGSVATHDCVLFLGSFYGYWLIEYALEERLIKNSNIWKESHPFDGYFVVRPLTAFKIEFSESLASKTKGNSFFSCQLTEDNEHQIIREMRNLKDILRRWWSLEGRHLARRERRRTLHCCERNVWVPHRDQKSTECARGGWDRLESPVWRDE